MNEEINRQINQILEGTEPELSNFEKSVRPAFNSTLSDKISDIFFIIFEPKTFSISIILSIIVFYMFFFSSLLLGFKITGGTLLISTALFYTILRVVKFIKNKIR